MARILSALAAGIVFGLGLSLSQMVNPAKVLAFLDLAGAFDPSLALVMGGALAVSAPAFALARRKGTHPLFAPAFQIPERRDIDARLVAGALVFGAGWGLAGLCPGPAVAALASGEPRVALFAAALAAGAFVQDRLAAGRR